jgi:hypothetical protein
MKKLIFALLMVLAMSCTLVAFDDINEYKGCEVLSITPDSVGSGRNKIDTYEVVVKEEMWGNYKTLLIQPRYGKLLKVGDKI